MKAYWDILRELREDHDLTQAEVAAVVGTTQQVYYRYEKGGTRCRCIICAHYALITTSAPTTFSACQRDCAGRAEAFPRKFPVRLHIGAKGAQTKRGKRAKTFSGGRIK